MYSFQKGLCALGGLESFWKKDTKTSEKNLKHFYVNMTFPELWLLVSSLFSLLFLRCTIQFQYVIYYCQIQLSLTEHFTAAKQRKPFPFVSSLLELCTACYLPDRLPVWLQGPGSGPKSSAPTSAPTAAPGRRMRVAAAIFQAFLAPTLATVN